MVPYKGSATLPFWGQEKTMNLNPMILTNIINSPYYKVALAPKKTYHELIDEIYYKVEHLEPWERGSRKTAGQTGMCGGVRGVGAGGIVSTTFCILYKLYTIKLTRKQLIGLINHADSPYIRGLGFMFIRYTQPPQDQWMWYEDYLDDEEEIDVKAGGGCMMTIGEMVRQLLTKLEWYSTMFPRIPVPIQKDIQAKLQQFPPKNQPRVYNRPIPDGEVNWGQAERMSQHRTGGQIDQRRDGSAFDRRRTPPPRSRADPHASRGRSRDREAGHVDDFARDLERERARQKHTTGHDREQKSSRHVRSRSKDRRSRSRGRRSRSRERRSRSRNRRSRSRDQHNRSKHRRSRSRDHHRGHEKSRKRSRSRDRMPQQHRSRNRSSDRHR